MEQKTEPSSDQVQRKTTVLTGVQPTGQPHLGNYVGAMRPAIESSRRDNVETWFFIADYHSLNKVHDPKLLREMTFELAAAWLACGLDPSRTIFYRQSDVPEILELSWILQCFTAKGLCNRAHSYKAKVQENEAAGKEDKDFGVNMGLFCYPVLMAADILMFSADQVPVGEDQVQHLEITRDIAQKFNRQYGNVLRLPSYVIQKAGKSVTGLDGRKMSKSYGNYIGLFEEPAQLKKLVARIKTDSLPPEAPKPVEGSIIFELYSAFAKPQDIEDMRAKFERGISWGVAKEELFHVINAELSGPRERFKQLMADRSYIQSALKEGADRARAVSVPRLSEIKRVIGIG